MHQMKAMSSDTMLYRGNLDGLGFRVYGMNDNGLFFT